MSASTTAATTSRWVRTLPRRRRWLAQGTLRRAAAPLTLALFALALCWKMLLGGLVVIGYDTMTYMYAYRYFAAQALRAGHIPLWNPHIYFGVPFLANLQSGVFYPPHVLFLVLPATTAMNWSVALHLFLAAFFTYAAARRILRVDPLSAAVAGAAFGFGGFIGAQVGHLNQLNAAAWLPAVLLTLHVALMHRSARWVGLTAAGIAVQLLAGHAQETFMTLVLLAAYAGFFVCTEAWQALVAPAFARDVASGNGAAQPPLAHRVKTWVGASLWAGLALGLAVALAGGLSAIQVLPTEELTAYSIRSGGLPFGEASAFSLPPRELFVGLLPTFGLASPSSSEYVGWIGFVGLSLVLVALTFRARTAAVLFFALLAGASLLLALGNHFPLYRWLFHLPGMSLFRVPARWLMLSNFSLAMLAGAGMGFLRQLARLGWPLEAPLELAGPWRLLVAASRLLVGVLIFAAAAAALAPLQRAGTEILPLNLPHLWLGLAAASVALCFWALATAPSRWPSAILAVAMLAELFAASRSLEYNNPNPPSVYTASRPVIEALQNTSDGGRLLSIAATGYQPSDAAQLVKAYESVLGPNGVLATLINTKFKEILNPNLPMVFGLQSVDGYDGGILPLKRYVQFKGLFVPPERNLPDSLLRDQIRPVPSAAQLRQLGVRYLLADTIGDVTRAGVYYDLSGSASLAGGERAGFGQIAARSPNEVSPRNVGPVGAIGLVTSLEGANGVPQGTPVLAVTLNGPGGQAWRGELLAGRDTAEGAYTAAARHSQPPPLGPAAGGAASATYLAVLPVSTIDQVSSVEVQSLIGSANGRVTIYGLTLIGALPGGTTSAPPSWPVTIAGGGGLRLVHHSDVKLYRNEVALPRAYLVSAYQVAGDAGEAMRLLGEPGHDMGRAVVLERAPAPLPPVRSVVRAAGRALRDDVKRWLGLFADPSEGTLHDGEVPPRVTQLGSASAVLATASVPMSSPPAATIAEERPEYLRLTLHAEADSFLVIRDTFYPGWTATVDGRPTTLLRADELFEALPMLAGDHEVVLRYSSLAFARGALISALAALATLAVAVVPFGQARIRRRRTAPADATPTERPLW